jgi:hypothetical protein
MNQPQHLAANPFALLMDPEAVFKAIANSERLERLHSRICRPLDRPLLPHAPAEGPAPDDFGMDELADEHIED